MSGPLFPPEPLAGHHEIGDFSSGEASLDGWLRRRAKANQVSGASRTYVVCEEKRVIGYYALASGAVTVESAPGRFKRNMPNPIPVAVLARLAVDRSWQGRGIGRAPHCACGRNDRASRNCRSRDFGRRPEILPCSRLRPEPRRADDADGHSV